MVFAAVVLIYYFLLDVPLALAMLVVTARIGLGRPPDRRTRARCKAGSGSRCCSSAAGSCSSSATCFEGRKPALADNLFQIFVAPIFLAAEVFFALGYKPQLTPERSS